MRRRTVIKAAAVLTGVPVALLACLVLYLSLADLSGWRDTVARILSDKLGRAVRITGEFEPEIGLTARLTAGGVTLASPDWSADATMASVDRLVLELDLWSLVVGPLTIRDVEIEHARVLLEKDAAGRANWIFGTGNRSTASSGPLELVLQHVLVEDLRLTWREPSRSADLEAEVTHFETTEDPTGMLDLALDGTVDHRAVRVSGRLGTLAGILNAGAVECDLTGQVGGSHFSARGTMAELKNLGGVDVTADVRGDDLADLRGLIDLPPELTGPFSLTVILSPATTGSDVQFDAAAAGVAARVAGTIDSLLEPQSFDATVTASGPSMRTVGAVAGVNGLADEEFSVTGGVHWQGFPITFRQVEITVGDNSLTADGVLGRPPTMIGTDFSLRGEGPDLSVFGALFRTDLPRERYSVSGRVARVENGLRIDDANLRCGTTIVAATGTVGDPPSYTGTTLSIHAEGTDLAQFSGLVGARLPAQPFTIDGRLAKGEQALALDGVSARVGEMALRVEGSLKTGKGLAGTTLQIESHGPDASQIGALTGLAHLPSEAWTLAGGLAVLDSGLRLDGVSATVGSLQAHGDGRLSTTKGLVGTDLQLHAEDADLSHTMAIFGVDGFPDVAAHATGGLRVEAGRIGLENATGSFGDIDVDASGLIGIAGGLDGTQLSLDVRGPRLASFEPFFHRPGLPSAPFSVAGDLTIEAGAWTSDHLLAEVDGNCLTVNGTLIPSGGLSGTDLQIDLTGPDLGRAGDLAAGFVALPELPPEPFSLATRLEIDESGYRLQSFRATLASAVAIIEGHVGPLPDLIGTDLTIDADGPDASLFKALTGVTVPAAPFQAKGRVQRSAEGYQFARVTLRLGDNRAEIHGHLGVPPRLVGTDLEISAAGPDLALVREIAGLEGLPDEPFTFSGRFEGTPESFAAEEITATVGASDIHGAIDVDFSGKTAVTARFESKVLDLAPFLPRRSEGEPPGDVPQEPSSAPPTRFFSDRPIDFSSLQAADADVEIDIGTLQLPLQRFSNVHVDAVLSDGRLEIPRFAATGQREGSGRGSLLLEPVADGYRLRAALDLETIRLDVPGASAQASASRPPFDLDVVLAASGRSPHDFASSSTGTIQLVASKGVLDSSLLDVVTAPIFATLIDTFNPFSKQETTSELECAVVLLTLDGGMARLDPMVLKSDKMTMLGDGTVDLATEQLNLEWVTKPRKGIGISASMLTNPYIRLGGTLSKPSIQLREVDAVISTGAAFATAGITLVARGLWDRVTAEKKVCQNALEKIAATQQGD